MRRLSPDVKLRIIGHSMGGPAAYELAQRAMAMHRHVDELVTLDPVGTHFGMDMTGGKPPNVDEWNNYYAANRDITNRKNSDMVAALGGAFDSLEGANNIPVEGDRGNHVTIRYAIPGTNGDVKIPRHILKKING